MLPSTGRGHKFNTCASTYDRSKHNCEGVGVNEEWCSVGTNEVFGRSGSTKNGAMVTQGGCEEARHDSREWRGDEMNPPA
jgi:hypothetical protein